MRICVIGDSHVSAIKKAWDTIEPNHGGVSITFFAARARMIARLTVNEGKLISPTQELADQMKLTSGGYQEIDPEEFDVFLVYGMLGALNKYYGRYRLVSQAFLREALIEHTQNSNLASQVKNMRSITLKPIFSALPPTRIVETDKPTKRMPKHIDVVAMLQENIFTSFDCELLRQPSETLVDGRTTATKYLTGAQRLQNATRPDNHPHRTTDRTHMNAIYGKLWLERFIQKIS